MNRAHHSSQAAVGPRHGDYPIRNPWMDTHPSSSSSSASRSNRSARRPGLTRLGPPPPATDWLRPPPQQLHGPQLNLAGPSRPPLPAFPALSIPGSSPAESAVGGLASGDGCGGEACDSFCYHCLQVVYIAGILTGVSLTIAGSVLRGSPRRGDLLVLVYIGVLLAAVCTLLLSVHYCVRRGVKQRKRAMRRPLPTTTSVAIPLQDLTELRQFPTELRQHREYPVELRHPRVHSMSRSRSHGSHGRRYYLEELQERPLEEWERQPYQPLIHRPR